MANSGPCSEETRERMRKAQQERRRVEKLGYIIDYRVGRRNWKKNNPELVKEYAKKYWANNKDRLSSLRREYWKNNADKCNDQKRFYKYGITGDDYRKLLAIQNGLCIICFVPLNGNIAIDHDHVTNKVRGILCKDCNIALGLVKDSPEVLRRLALYIECCGDKDFNPFGLFHNLSRKTE